MPDLSASNKETLFSELTHAKGLKRLVTVTFKIGQEQISPMDALAIKASLGTDLMQPLLSDPRAVFVVLGYASKTGSPQLNMRLSQQRANAVMNNIQIENQVRNPVYSLPMGESTLFGSGKSQNNQVAELWIVLP
jgi:outer membrane protein OmpA-like peptidoglycan-associated protein